MRMTISQFRARLTGHGAPLPAAYGALSRGSVTASLGDGPVWARDGAAESAHAQASVAFGGANGWIPWGVQAAVPAR